MQNLINLLLLGLSIGVNYRRAKLKNARVLTGVLLGLFLNFIGVAIFFYMTRTRSIKPQKPTVNKMTSS